MGLTKNIIFAHRCLKVNSKTLRFALLPTNHYSGAPKNWFLSCKLGDKPVIYQPFAKEKKQMAEVLIGIIGGSGLGEALVEHITDGESHEIDTPFGRPSGSILIGRLGKNKIAFLNRHGPGHKLSPSVIPFTANIFALKELGVRAIISSGAVGSLREQIHPKELIIIDQFIDKTFRRQSSFFEGAAAVHCEFSMPVCDRLRKKLLRTAENIDVKSHAAGTYLCMEGPQFSTRAESLTHRAWGGDVVGMTALPEAKLAREAQICYALVALASDYDCWQPHEQGKDKQTLLQEIIGNLQAATANAIKLIELALNDNDDLVNQQCTCRKSLELAVWTAQQQFAGEEKEKLKVLFE